jgi:hypothetical protein
MYLARETVKMDDDLKDKLSYLVTAWMLLDKSEPWRHLLNGIKDACDRMPFLSDGRADSDSSKEGMLSESSSQVVERTLSAFAIDEG